MKICPQCESQYPSDVRFCPTDGSTLRALDGGADLIGQVIADRYVVHRKLGEGGMGQVYLAEHVRMGRRSALKVMHPGMMHDADAIARFNREAANASRISHPGVAAIYDFGETSDGLIYLAMEFVEGEPLTAIVERQGALPAQRVAAIVEQVAGALAAAHDLGIVHRDLKPDNIMIARGRDGADIVKVVDFGIAKSTGVGAQRVTRTGYIVGTPEYMSPEQLAGDALDGRSDIYALGLVTFHLLTGALPFPSATVQESMIMRLTERPRTLAEVNGAVPWPGEVQAVLDRALAREASARYADARQFAGDLSTAVERMPEVDARTAGTLVMGAPLPATRVAAATRMGGAQYVPRAPAALARSRATAFVAAAIVLVAGTGAAAWMLSHRGEGSDIPTSTTIAQRDTSTVSGTAPPEANPGSETVPAGPRSEGAQTDLERRAIADPPRSEPAPVEPFTAPRPAFAARPVLDSLGTLLDPDNDRDTDARARQGLARIGVLLPKLENRSDSLEALYRRAEAHAMLDDHANACATLDTIYPGAEGLRAGGIRASITALHTALGCRR